MAVGSNIIRNPFQNAKIEAPTFVDPGKRAPNDQIARQTNTDDPSITDLSANDGFEPDGVTPKKKKAINASSDDPMLDHEHLWDDPVIDKDNPPKEFKGYLPDIDPTKFAENVGKIDFSKKINPEVLKKIVAGGDEALAAFPELINSIAREAFTASFNANSKMTKAALDNVERHFMDDLIPNSIQNRLVDDQVSSDNELATNPKYAPMFKSVKAQFAKKFPKASPEQISKATNVYMTKFMEDGTKKNVIEDDNTKKLQKGTNDADWESWLNPEQQT